MVVVARFVILVFFLWLLGGCGKGGGGARDEGYPPVVIPGYEIASIEDPGTSIVETREPGPSEEGPDPFSPEKEFETLQDEGKLEDDASLVLETEVPCIPSCANKECGNDGCGGLCGTCPANHICQSGKCICVPSCSGKECGEDGCGGQCPPGCKEDLPCLEGGRCAKLGPCSKHYTLTCSGETSSHSVNNGFKPNSDVLDLYSCDAQIAHGPENVFQFVPDQSGEVTFSLEGPVLPEPPAFLNLYLLEDKGDGCYSSNCVAFGHKAITFHVLAGHTYYLVVDAVQNNTATYYISVSCPWSPMADR